MAITWTTYCWYSIVLLSIYYGCVVFIFFKKELKLKFSSAGAGDLKLPADRLLFKEAAKTENTEPKLDAASAAPMHSLVDELQAYFAQVESKEAEKLVVTEAVKRLLQKYPGIKESVFQQGITNLIGVLAEDKCAIHFSADELVEVWNE